MTILEELNNLLSNLGIPVETGEFSDSAPGTYSVLTPLSERFEIFGDNWPLIDVNEVRISLFTKGNYLETKRQLTQALLQADFTITDRLFVGFEKDTKYFHLAIDVAKHYEMEG
ncbi:hypothetical protein O1N65_002366 [Listeria monocytogenes]|uniref:Uncharacterized protein n=2 Tax=Listeria monocytogenes TaxID=1639 RepID=A0A823FRW0_LISMN|nr:MULTISPECIES: hypothetical protein [Bacilli]EAE3706357.1 hypothetical protein [Listeria monocytogenes serotype 1/2b]ANE39607.1 hypothetical protein AAV53_10450 [Listeria monocytogenes]AQP80018.1 hypothetical protein B0X21_09575 [Listeria monocytogenes]EAC2470310.1 hypothetical protein [Listeria monocytogenes]EAC2470520.1 hypothetical protein [Listeria monocytogenes]